MAGKMNDALDAKKVELASSMVQRKVEEPVEEAVEKTVETSVEQHVEKWQKCEKWHLFNIFTCGFRYKKN